MTIKELAKLNEEYVVATRRHLHKHPELSTKEYETTAFIKAELEKLGIEVQTFDDITGCIGTIHGAKPGKTVMLRADIDALPIQETNDKPYCSVNPGVMHACGHDAHAA
ncbi:MAG: M20/M25/M40 family metallo-hydrolase, partial [Oscillospiraceae bacterium]|nr:M20/M25/M40 family metallo-hydrolase [Oscillospiraceae bacterium]